MIVQFKAYKSLLQKQLLVWIPDLSLSDYVTLAKWCSLSCFISLSLKLDYNCTCGIGCWKDRKRQAVWTVWNSFWHAMSVCYPTWLSDNYKILNGEQMMAQNYKCFCWPEGFIPFSFNKSFSVNLMNMYKLFPWRKEGINVSWHPVGDAY